MQRYVTLLWGVGGVRRAEAYCDCSATYNVLRVRWKPTAPCAAGLVNYMLYQFPYIYDMDFWAVIGIVSSLLGIYSFLRNDTPFFKKNIFLNILHKYAGN